MCIVGADPIVYHFCFAKAGSAVRMSLRRMVRPINNLTPNLSPTWGREQSPSRRIFTLLIYFYIIKNLLNNKRESTCVLPSPRWGGGEVEITNCAKIRTSQDAGRRYIAMAMPSGLFLVCNNKVSNIFQVI